jgi:hypothetical protein
MKHSVKIHLIHVSGKRMISQGTDGISRGSLIEGVRVIVFRFTSTQALPTGPPTCLDQF